MSKGPREDGTCHSKPQNMFCPHPTTQVATPRCRGCHPQCSHAAGGPSMAAATRREVAERGWVAPGGGSGDTRPLHVERHADLSTCRGIAAHCRSSPALETAQHADRRARRGASPACEFAGRGCADGAPGGGLRAPGQPLARLPRRPAQRDGGTVNQESSGHMWVGAQGRAVRMGPGGRLTVSPEPSMTM